MRRFLLVVLAIALLSGCGGVDGTLFATAVRNTKEAGGAEVAFQWNYDIPGMDKPVVMLGRGFEDVSKRHARITAQLPAESPIDGDIEAVVDGPVMYMRAPFLDSELGGKDWMKIDLARTYRTLGVQVDALGQVGQGTAEQLDALAHVSDGVNDEGREIVRGVEATHYSATVDFDKLPDEKLQAIAKLGGDSRIEVDVWIDDAKRIRRMEWAQSLPNDGVQMTMIMEYVRFGVPVDIEPPDDGDVFDATDVTIQELQQALN
jgi:hypothetical protein